MSLASLNPRDEIATEFYIFFERSQILIGTYTMVVALVAITKLHLAILYGQRFNYNNKFHVLYRPIILRFYNTLNTYRWQMDNQRKEKEKEKEEDGQKPPHDPASRPRLCGPDLRSLLASLIRIILTRMIRRCRRL